MRNVASDVRRNNSLGSRGCMMSLAKAGMTLDTNLISLSEGMLGTITAFLLSVVALDNASKHVRRDDGANSVVHRSHVEGGCGIEAATSEEVGWFDMGIRLGLEQ